MWRDFEGGGISRCGKILRKYCILRLLIMGVSGPSLIIETVVYAETMINHTCIILALFHAGLYYGLNEVTLAYQVFSGSRAQSAVKWKTASEIARSHQFGELAAVMDGDLNEP